MGRDLLKDALAAYGGMPLWVFLDDLETVLDDAFSEQPFVSK